MAFSDALRIKIDESYREREFSQKDFHSIAISHGMSVKNIRRSLEIFGESRNHYPCAHDAEVKWWPTS